ncbi:MAG: peptidylprolyl isomerase, partial [Dehalococcoidia bacterium]
PVGGPRGRRDEPPRRPPQRQRGGRPPRRARADKEDRRTTRDERERFRQLLLVGAVGLVIVAAIAIAAFGYYQTQIAPKHKTVLQVGETRFSLSHFERRLRLELETNPALQQIASDLPDFVLSQLENEGVLLEAAPRLGIEVTEDDIDAEIGRRTGVSPGGDERLFASAYRQDVRDSGLHADEYRRMLRADLLEQGVQAKFRDEAPAREPQARARLILVETEEQAQEVIQRLEAGEDFAALVQELSLDPASKERGGEVDWLVQGTMLAIIDDFLFSAEPGTLSGPLDVSGLYVVLDLLEQEERDLSDTQKDSVANREYREWLDETKPTLQVVRSLDPEDEQDILSDALGDIGGPASVPGGSSGQ